MTAPNNKPVPRDVLVRFALYYEKHPAWGSLHIVLDDGNVRDSDVAFCQRYAREEGDEEGVFLADVLADLSKSQRLNLTSRLSQVDSDLRELDTEAFLREIGL